MADTISQIKLPDNKVYDIKDNTKLPLSGGTVTGQTTFNKSIHDAGGQTVFAGGATRSTWYKITLATNGITPPSSQRWYMCSMSIHVGGSYGRAAKGVIEVSYYMYWTGTAFRADWVYATAIGNSLDNVNIYYKLTDPFVIYVGVLNAYTSLWVDKVSYGDSSYGYRTNETKVETSDAIITTDYSRIPIVKIYSTNGNDIFLNNSTYPSSNNSYNLGDTSHKWANVYATKFIGALQGNADTAISATTASKLGSSNVGSATQPIYLNGGTATACTYTLGKSVPSDAVFTDTKNTAGSTDTSSKIFLIGATSQAANPQTYSQDTAYVGTDGCLYSGGTKVLTAHQDISGKADKSATVSTVTWSNNKLTKTINGTTSDVVSAATILGNLTSSQVTTALGYTPASVNTTYDFESPDDSISFNGRAVGSVVTVDMTVNGKANTDDLAREYSSDTVQLYNTGDLVYYDGDMYRCINGTSGGNWISSCWQRTSVATELENKIEGLMVAGSSGGSYASEVTTSIWFDPNQFNYLTGSHKVELNSNFDPNNKVSKTGDTMTGDISWNGETGCTSGLYWKEYGYGDKFKIAPSFSGFNDDNFLGFQAAVGGAGTDPDLAVILKIHPSGKITTTNQVIGKNPASSWIGARDNACFINPNFANNGSYYPVISTKSKSGTWSIGVLSNEEQLRFCWESDSNYSSGKNESTSVILRATAGTIALTSEILPKAGGTMTGNLVCGNITIYSSGSNGGRNSMIIGDDCKLGDCNVGGMLGLQAASGTNCGIRLYNGSGGLIGGFQSTNGTPQWINSSGTATTISLAGHGHSYLPLSGGTVTGDTTFSKKVQVSGIFKCAVISRYDNNDSGYVNHVNQENNAYRPVRASAFTTMSCKHTKTNIVDISEEDALKLLDIRPVNFDYVEEVGGQKDQIGVLAEDTYEVLPKVVSVPDDYVEEDFDISKGIHQPLPSVDYAKFVPYLIKMVQIQEREIDSLKKIIDKLEINI